MRAGVDIGGTFTDLCIAGPDGIVAIGKALGTPAAPANSVETVLHDALESQTFGGSDLTQVVHATTLVTNALIERKGATVALHGHGRLPRRDGARARAALRHLPARRLAPRAAGAAPPALRGGRAHARGRHDRAGRRHAKKWRRWRRSWPSAGIEAVAICFLHSFANAAQRAGGTRGGRARRARTCASRSPATSRRRSASTSARRPRWRTSTSSRSRRALPGRPRGATGSGRAAHDAPAGDALQRRRRDRAGCGRASRSG